MTSVNRSEGQINDEKAFQFRKTAMIVVVVVGFWTNGFE